MGAKTMNEKTLQGGREAGMLLLLLLLAVGRGVEVCTIGTGLHARGNPKAFDTKRGLEKPSELPQGLEGPEADNMRLSMAVIAA